MLDRQKSRTDSLFTCPIMISDGTEGLFLQIGKKEIRFEVGDSIRLTSKQYKFACEFPSVSSFNARSDQDRHKVSVCRVCQDADAKRQLIAPCNCTETEQFVHENCLKYWLMRTDLPFELNKCQVCESSIDMNFEFSSPSLNLNSREGLGILILLLFSVSFSCISLFVAFSQTDWGTDTISVVCVFGFLALLGFVCIIILTRRLLKKKSIVGWNIYSKNSIL